MARKYKHVHRKEIDFSLEERQRYNAGLPPVIRKREPISDLVYKSKEQKNLYDKYRDEVNQHIEEYNKMVSLLEQAEIYYSLEKKPELSATEHNQMSVCRIAMHSYARTY